MSVKELIDKLSECDPAWQIEVPVQTYTQAYPSGYFGVSRVQPSPYGGSVRLYVHLGKGYSISKRKARP